MNETTTPITSPLFDLDEAIAIAFMKSFAHYRSTGLTKPEAKTAAVFFICETFSAYDADTCALIDLGILA